MKLRILSDLHTEGYLFKYSRLDEDVIVLAGDIGVGKQTVEFIKHTFPKDIPIIFVAGNHEFYHHDIGEITKYFHEQFDGTNVHFLDNSEIIINDVRFLGGTMHSDFNLFGIDPFAEAACARGINDFHCINKGGKVWTTKDCREEFIRFDRYMTHALSVPYSGKTVIVTHFCPSVQSVHPRFLRSLITPFFSSNVEHLMGFNDLWIHGHTHDSYDYVLNGTRVLCNPRGYGNENAEVNVELNEKHFNPNLIVEI